MEGKLAFIVAMMLATYPARVLPLLALSSRRIPASVEEWLSYVPPAVFSALVFPGILLREGAPAITPGNPHIWAGLATLLVTLTTRNLSKAVAAGIVVAFIGELLLG